ncbi:MAG: gamma-glutamyl-gamma-aminobutyrate hydrolase family protein [Rhodospirillaceae bacterium]|nr:gamma-glutamyl-gamma-aminobutyrate hydrolase family protein [Rhodospirillaceae bacterium]
MVSEGPLILVIDGYPKDDRENLAGCGMTTAGDLYVAMLSSICPQARFEVLFPSDPDAALPDGVQIGDFDGVAWTGCSLTIHDNTDKRVRRHIELARAAYMAGVPQYGTCWGIQIAAVAAGGTVAVNPRGREMGIGRKITLSPAGRGHPLYQDKPTTFDGFVSHFDEVTHLPPGAEVLAGNAFVRVHSLSVDHEKGTFWGLQYHPEYDLYQMARLIYCRRAALTNEGFYTDEANALEMVEKFERLYANPDDMALAWQLGVDQDILNDTVRQTEPRNWLERLVLPKMR